MSYRSRFTFEYALPFIKITTPNLHQFGGVVDWKTVFRQCVLKAIHRNLCDSILWFRNLLTFVTGCLFNFSNMVV